MANSTSSESSSTSGSDYSNFEAFIEGEDNERIYEPIGEIRRWRFEPPRRTEIQGESWKRIKSPWPPQSGKRRMVSTIRF